MLPFEVHTYYIQHVLILVIPYYLMRLGGIYTPEPLNDFSWALMTFSLMMLYHFVILQPLAMITYFNLNNIICPAVSDPFNGQWYRCFAVIHQFFLIVFMGKIYTILAKLILTPLRPFSSYEQEDYYWVTQEKLKKDDKSK
ncbi:hypothetical protein A3Q56_07813 [Intoshia linei]|uniref:Transmembrane protein 164 n=1 Tax=Intoshia linei TaxID=1819745 RepID=A0A177AR70_9BILA|nr:hypothetical protein A3Q56_07813 [Intoshia linei]